MALIQHVNYSDLNVNDQRAIPITMCKYFERQLTYKSAFHISVFQNMKNILTFATFLLTHFAADLSLRKEYNKTQFLNSGYMYPYNFFSQPAKDRH